MMAIPQCHRNVILMIVMKIILINYNHFMVMKEFVNQFQLIAPDLHIGSCF